MRISDWSSDVCSSDLLFIGTFVGAITFSGSVIAFGKLSGKYKFRLFQGAPVVFSGQHMVNLVLALAMLGCGLWFMATQMWLPFIIMTLLAFVLGVLILIPIGGADMPVVVSMRSEERREGKGGVRTVRFRCSPV